MGLKHGDENFMDQFYLWNCIGNPTMNFSKPKWTLNFLDFWQNKELNVTRKYHKYQTIPIKLVVFIINVYVYKAFVIVDINDSSNNFLSNSYVESKLCVWFHDETTTIDVCFLSNIIVSRPQFDK